VADRPCRIAEETARDTPVVQRRHVFGLGGDRFVEEFQRLAVLPSVKLDQPAGVVALRILRSADRTRHQHPHQDCDHPLRAHYGTKPIFTSRGACPTPKVEVTILEGRAMTEQLLALKLVTYAKVPVGLMAMSCGPSPTGIVVTIVLVAMSITDTSSDSWLVT